METRKERSTRKGIYVLNLLFSTQVAITIYFNAAFLLERGVSDSMLGVVYAAASIFAVFALIFSSQILSRIGNYTTFVWLAALTGIAFIWLAVMFNTALIVLLFMFITTTTSMLYFSLDMFLESVTREEHHTGEIRATFMTAYNFAFVAAPLVGGFILADANFSKLYLTAAAIMTILVLVASLVLHRTKDPVYKHLSLQLFWGKLRASLSTRSIFAVQFLLRFLTAVLVVYIPIYLLEHMHFSLTQVGIISSIMLSAFVILEIPLAKIGDARWGEKEMLIVGFVISALSVGALAFITEPSLAVWAAALFMTRVGASMIDIMSESYFFKHVDGDDADDVSAFRTLYPLSYVVGPLFGTALLTFASFQVLFIALAAVMLLGIPAALSLKDTK